MGKKSNLLLVFMMDYQKLYFKLILFVRILLINEVNVYVQSEN